MGEERMPFPTAKQRVGKSPGPRSAQLKSDPSERRTQPRFTAQFRSTFVSSHHEGQGRTLDLSMSGCKIESDTPVTKGVAFECRLHVPGLDWPLRVDEAVIRWVAGNTFGLEFTRLLPEEQAKLKTVIENIEQGS
jgi:hypothetical protein